MKTEPPRRPVERRTPVRPTSSNAKYMTTALAVQLLPEDDDKELTEGKMGFLEHLDEIRKRIIRSCIAVAVGMLVAFLFIDRIVAFVLAPSRRMLPSGAKLIYTQPGEAFGLYIQVALIAGGLLAAPYVMFQVWRFIAPDGTPKRRNWPFRLCY